MIKKLNNQDINFLSSLLLQRNTEYSKLRNISEERLREHQTNYYRSLIQSDSVNSLWSCTGGKSAVHFLNSYADNLYSLNQSSIPDLLYGDDCSKDDLLPLIEFVLTLTSEGRKKYLQAVAAPGGNLAAQLFSSFAFQPESLYFLRKPAKTGRKIRTRILEADYSMVPELMEIGRRNITQVLSPLRYSSPADMVFDYGQGHSFDWWFTPENFYCFAAYDSCGSCRGFLTFELNRVDSYTGTDEAHLVDFVFDEDFLSDNFSDIIFFADNFLVSHGQKLLVWPVYTHHANNIACFIEAADRVVEIERIAMLRKIS